MSSIRLDKFKKESPLSTTNSDFTYTDIHLDFEYSKFSSNDLARVQINRDLRVSFDEDAIKNSLINLFNTRPGQRILIPEYGTNIYGTLFESVTEVTGRTLGNHILHAIERWEPRVKVAKVNVIADSDEHQYTITIVMYVPTLKKTTKLTGVMAKEGFTEVQEREFI